MKLRLEQVGRRVDGETWLYPMDLSLEAAAVTVLLGVTRAGKTSLMRVMAGLDRPTEGRIEVDGRDVTGVPVRERAVAMVYQQFINYPSLSVYDNIASPLRLRRATDVDQRVREIAATLHIDQLLQRLPQALSGGQQQRVALARALAKDAPLMLLDEPLVNLDYKLREELRAELTQLFSDGQSSVVYATTEPGEALQMGGYTAVLSEGRLLQYGPTLDVFRRPATIAVARAFSDPPMNLFEARVDRGSLLMAGDVRLTLPASAAGIVAEGRAVTVGFRPIHVDLKAGAATVPLVGEIELAEISGSDSYLYARTALGEVIAQRPGVTRLDIGQRVDLFVDTRGLYLFDDAGRLLLAPAVTEA